MRISEIHITNFRALREFYLANIPDLVVLAGPNGTGKSTVLEAIALWKEAIAPYSGRRPLGPDPVSEGADYATITVAVEFAGQEVHFWQQRLESAGESLGSAASGNLVGVVEIRRDGNIQKAQVVGGTAGLTPLLQHLDVTSPIGVMEYIGPYRKLPQVELASIPITPISPDRDKAIRLQSIDNKYDELKHFLVALDARDWQRVYYGEGEREDSSRELRELFEQFFAPKKLKGTRSVETPQGPRLRILIETPAGTHDVDGLSSGEKEILMVFATLQRLRLKNSTLLYDEPELHLNAALERKVVPELVRLGTGNQIWVSTHSVEVINSTPLENLFVMTHYAGKNQVGRAESARDRISLFQFLGADTGIQLISERVVFIEGEDNSADKEMLEAIFADYRHQVSFVPCGSASVAEWVSQRGLELLEQASQEAQFFFVRDRDFLSDKEIAELRGILHGRVWVWRRYHIENYLLEPTAIHRALERLRVTTFESPKAVDDKLKELADSLKEETLVRWVGAEVNREIGAQDFRIAGDDSPLERLCDKASAALKRMSANLTDSEIRSRIEEKQRAMSGWDSGLWREVVPGKRLLRLFAGLINGGLRYEHLRSLILTEIKDDSSLWPSEFEELKEKVTEGLR